MSPAVIRISCIAMAGCLVLALPCAGQTTQTQKALTSAEELELRTLTGQLADTSRALKTRMEAAELLLSRTYPQAADALMGFLADATNRASQIAVAEAIAKRGDGRSEFIEPLMAMLTGEESSVRAAAARALSVYRNDGVTDRLIAIAQDGKRPAAVRVEVIASLPRALEQKVAGALVGLLEDRDPAVASAAGDALGRLANIRTFGADAARWRAWWNQNKDKPRSQWLAELATSLSRSQAELEAENARICERLAKATEDLYAAAQPAQRDAMLLGLLRDPMGDVRLVGLRLVEGRLSSSAKVPPDVRAQAKAMLADADGRVRQKAALLLAALGEPDAGKVLLDRLAVEESPEVRIAVLTALGQLADPAALPVVLREIRSKKADVAAAAARALGRIVAKQRLDDAMQAQAVKALGDRYEQVARAQDGVELPEAILTAMGATRSAEFLPLLRAAMKDPAATVRLAAVNGLRQFGAAEAAADIETLVGDGDRGVRQAVISALGSLGGAKSLQTILRRTDPSAETDATVRQQAWEAAMGLLSKADAAVLSSTASGLASRADAADWRIKIRQMLVAALRADKSPALPDALRQLGLDLLRASRPAEAAPALGEAHAALAAAKSEKAVEVWHEWIDALLGADDRGAAKAIGEQADEKAFAAGLQRLLARLDALSEKGKWQPMVQLAAGALEDLAARLTPEQVKVLQERRDEAKAKAAEADRQKVPALVTQLVSAEESARKAAAAELQAMGEPVVPALLEELKKALAGENENRPLEAAVLEVLKQIAPRLTGYDAGASKADRLKTIEGWRK